MKKTISFIIALVVLALALCGYLVFKDKKIDVESSQVKELYSYLGSNSLELCNGLITYTDKEVNKDTIDNSDKLCIAYTLLENELIDNLKVDTTKKKDTCSINDSIVFGSNSEDKMCSITKVSSDELSKKYQSIYNEEIKDYSDFLLDSTTICKYSEGYYYCGLAEEYTITIGAEPKTYRSIEKAIEKDNDIIIYDYFIKVVNDECYSNWTTDKKDEKCSKELNPKNVSYKFLKKYGTKYKHTFTKDDKGSYHWIKSEPTK